MGTLFHLYRNRFSPQAVAHLHDLLADAHAETQEILESLTCGPVLDAPSSPAEYDSWEHDGYVEDCLEIRHLQRVFICAGFDPDV